MKSLSEFSLIETFFANKSFAKVNAGNALNLTLGIGDDAAIIEVPDGHELVITTDTSISGCHFLQQTQPFDIAYRSVAVSLSDLAAMGASPYGFLINLTLENKSETWLRDFSNGVAMIAERYHLTLIGGDTTKGPLSVSVTHLGVVPKHQAIKRSGAKPGDLIVVSGFLGDAAGGLACMEQSLENHYLTNRFLRPDIRLNLGCALRNLATACIDISDGLLADLGHIIDKSGVGAVIEFKKIPISTELMHYWGENKARQVAVCAGDDYELCFTIPPDQENVLAHIANELPMPLTIIGEINEHVGELQCLDASAKPMLFSKKGFDHFI